MQSHWEGGVTPDGLETLVRAQLGCLEQPMAQCEPVTVPDSLFE
jgi:hypothetical protein